MTGKIPHLVAHAPNGWGHIKPLLALFERMFELRSPAAFAVTFLSSGPMLPKIARELQLMPGSLKDKINVVDVGVPPTIFGPIPGVLPSLERIRDGKPLICLTTGRQYNLPPPTVVVIDGMAAFLPSAVKAAAGDVPLVHWMPCPISASLHMFGPEAMGGHGDLDAKIIAAAEAQGKPEAEVADALYDRKEGAIIETPGVPALYDYEFNPQEVRPVLRHRLPPLTAPPNIFGLSLGLFIRKAHRYIQAADGLLVVSASSFEGNAIEAGRAWLAESGQDVWAVGPLENAPPAATAPVPGAEVPLHSKEDAEILSFLDDMEKSHGANSVIFVAFGSTFYPKDTAKLHAFLDELLTSGTPFLWSHASPFAKVPEELSAKIDACASAFHASWVPQRAILRHAATGWFVSHGGWNSTQEALSLKVPTIMWPFGGDQPGNAALLSITHEAAFELLSVREGDGAQQPLRAKGKAPVDFSVNGVRKETQDLLIKLKGPEGQRVRANAERLGDELDKSWKEGGEARRELQRFMHKFLGSP